MSSLCTLVCLTTACTGIPLLSVERDWGRHIATIYDVYSGYHKALKRQVDYYIKYIPSNYKNIEKTPAELAHIFTNKSLDPNYTRADYYFSSPFQICTKYCRRSDVCDVR